MSTITRFEDLEIWKLAREINIEIHLYTKNLPFKTDFPLIDQIKRPSGSIMDNIAEGYERDGIKEFIQFLSYSKGSAGETRSQLHRTLDFVYITLDQLNAVQLKLLQLSAKIQNLITYLKKSGYKGNKFKSI